MKAPASTKMAIIFIGAIAVIWFGYGWIADYGDAVASGAYEAIAKWAKHYAGSQV